MRTIVCWLHGCDWLRDYQPGLLRLRCQRCGTVTPGLRGPVSPALAPVVRARKLPKPKVPTLKMVKRRSA